MFKEEHLDFLVGDISDEGHGKSDSIPMIVRVEQCVDCDVIAVLEAAEDDIINKLGIDIKSWFSDYGEDYIKPEDVNKLKDLGVAISDSTINKDGYLFALSPWDYFKIWKQLVERADPSITIRPVLVRGFTSICSGYGLFR